MNLIEGTGEIAPEPDWPSIFSDELDIAAASNHWRLIIAELRTRNLLAGVNGPSVERLVMAYVIYGRSAREVAENGAVTKPRRGNTKAIARVSPHWSVMREAGNDADRMEAELGIAPRRRSSASKVEKSQRPARPADAYLRPVA